MGHVLAVEARERDDVLDALLRDARRDSAEFPVTLANHGPMVLAILARLGASDARLRTALDRYRAAHGLVPVPPQVAPIDRESWTRHFGERGREGDYRAFFDREVVESGIELTVRRFLPELLPGIAGSALHPLMRLAYGILRQDPAEVATALAYWACCVLPLPPAIPALQTTARPDEALLPSPSGRGAGGEGQGREAESRAAPDADLPDEPSPLAPLHKGEWNRASATLVAARETDDPAAVLARIGELPGLRGLPPQTHLWHAIRAAAAEPAFAPVVDWLRIGPETLRRMAATSLALFAGTMDFAALHAVTGTHWVRLVHAVCPDPLLIRHFWQAVAALVPAIGFPELPTNEKLNAWRALPCPAWPDITAAALASDDEHDVSLVFSAREEQKVYGDRLYRVVAARRMGLIA